MTAAQLLAQGERILLAAEIEESSQDAWILFSFVTGFDRTRYFLERDADIEPVTAKKYFAAIDRRKEHVPVQYVTGEAWFMGHRFYVDEHVLIPRQDTEVLVEQVLKRIKPGDAVLDMCTGSGCIILSLLLQTEAARGVASDISAEALLVAKKNAACLGVENVALVLGNLFENIEGKFDVIVSNPPYVESAVIDGLSPEVAGHEPRIALDGHADGMYFYREITSASKNFLKENGYLCYEIGHNQGVQVKALLEEAGFAQVQVIKDLAGLDRVVIGKRRE